MRSIAGEAKEVENRRGVSSKYHQSDVVPPIVEQWAPWVGAPTIFAPRVCLKARPLLSLPAVAGIRYGSVSDFAQPMSNI
jgi:hypothetical protein